MLHNNTKVWLFILFSSLLLLIIGYEWAERLGLLIGFLCAVLMNFFVFIYGDSRILAKLEAQRLQGQDPWGLLEIVQNTAQKLDMITPEVYITPHAAVNAFCVGHSLKGGSLGFTTGLLNRLQPDELEAVITHQMCHIRRLDNFSYSISSTFANAIVGLGQFLDSLLPYKLQFFMPLLSPVGWIIIKGVVGPKSVFENDLMASQILESRARLGEVLWRLEGLAGTIPLEPPPCTSHLFLVNPEGFSQKNIFLRSHPDIEVRLKKLMGYYPI